MNDLALAYWFAWARVDPETHLERVWGRLAYATRYGHIPLSEALSLGTRELLQFNRALDRIVEQENNPKKGG